LRSDQVLRSVYMGVFQLPWLPERVLRDRLTDTLVGTGLPHATAQHYQERMREPGAARGAVNWYRAVPLTRQAPRPVTVPTTFVWGRQDPFLGPVAAHRTGHHVRADYEFAPVPGGHWLPELAPGVVADAVVRRARGAG
ncbi:MAG TPA: hypothetical protein VK046_08815, partial [Actinomycetaceae bacterium]|nr:hypothetical protein [Actinomycetaceae bacterium]